jgi:hypothetical protein
MSASHAMSSRLHRSWRLNRYPGELMIEGFDLATQQKLYELCDYSKC